MLRTNQVGFLRRVCSRFEKVAEAFIKQVLLLISLALINNGYYDYFIFLWTSSCLMWRMSFCFPQRPLAISVVGQMKDPTFATFMYLLCCGKQSSFFCSQGQEYTVVFWDGKEDTR